MGRCWHCGMRGLFCPQSGSQQLQWLAGLGAPVSPIKGGSGTGRRPRPQGQGGSDCRLNMWETSAAATITSGEGSNMVGI